MKLTYDLGVNNTIKNGIEHGLLIPDSLEIEVDSKNLTLSEVFIFAQNVITGKEKNIKGKSADLTDLLESGKIEIAVMHYIDGVCTRTWRIEPIIIKEVEGVYHAFPEIEVLENEIKNLKKSIVDLAKLIKNN